MSKNLENLKSKKKSKFQQMREHHTKLIDQVTQVEIYDQNLDLLRKIIEVIIWGDQNKMAFTAVSPLPESPLSRTRIAPFFLSSFKRLSARAGRRSDPSFVGE